MALNCVDKITEILPGQSIRGQTKIRADEEYFQDHFTGHPVVPGALMLECLVQLSAWFVRFSQGFTHSQVHLAECSQVKYSHLVRPEAVLDLSSQLIKQDGHLFLFKGRVQVGDRAAVSAKFTLRARTVGEIEPKYTHLEQSIRMRQQSEFALIRGVCSS